MIRRLLHRFAHLAGWNFGEVVTEWHEGQIWVGFRCSTCGEVSGAHTRGLS